jgi:hypothetical protein
VRRRSFVFLGDVHTDCILKAAIEAGELSDDAGVSRSQGETDPWHAAERSSFKKSPLLATG